MSASGAALVRADDGSLLAAVDEDADAVVLLARSGGALVVRRRLAVGRRPAQALFASSALWVIERGDNALSAYDVATGRRLCRRSVARDPVSVARSPDGATLFVASALPPRLHGLDARTGGRRFTVAVAREPRGLWVAPAGDRVLISHLAGPALSAVDLRATPAARALPPPTFELRQRAVGGESSTSFTFRPSATQAWSIAREPASGRLLVPMMANNHRVDIRHGAGSGGYGGGGGEGLDEQTRFTVGVFDPSAERWERLIDGDYFADAEGAPPGLREVRSPVASAWSPREGLVVLAQGNDAVASLQPGRPPRWPARVAPRQRATLNAPDALVVEADGEVVIHSQVDHAVEYGAPRARVRLSFGEERLDPRVALGRRLFLSASSRISRDRVSCNGCHPDGRDDGLAWDLRDQRLRTPSLRGRLTPPFGWLGRQPTLIDAVRVAVERLHGTGLSDEALLALAAYIERALPAAPAASEPLSAQAERGRALFQGRAGCARCHVAERGYVDGAAHAFGADPTPFDTPSLRGVAAGGPWFHDGRYTSLAALLADPRSAMGNAASLSPDERADLLAWIEAL
ncbi:MAG: PQQ-binding-like beta-propeller repeat protein [Polyangiales bacterium]